jgi:hypothetical protein
LAAPVGVEEEETEELGGRGREEQRVYLDWSSKSIHE